MKKVKRLFEQFQPENYQLHLIPDAKKMTFAGTVTIKGKKVGRPSQRLTFHQKDLKITGARIVRSEKKGDTNFEVTRINNQNSFNEVRLHTGEQLFPGQFTVIMEFTGKITKPMNGIYPCFFKHDGKDKILLATQFESHHAREAFPCIDEPEAKATFDLALTSPKGQTVISNTPARTTIDEGSSNLTVFETTPRMSVYLLAFVIGEVDFKEAKTKDGVTVRAFSTPANVHLTEHSLDVAVKTLEFFSDYFATPYPLPKLDMIALPDFSSGAMENWGLVTYRETTMLTNLEHSSIESKQMVALVVAHELSHQWFGNLVTMKWWDDLWLNESFANLMEYRAVDELYPEWKIWEQFVSMEGASAKRRDSLLGVQAVKTNVNHPDEISTLFDPSIVYAKGGTILYMLLNYIGEESFKKGLHKYFEKHRYGNTVANDLWEALGEASQKPVSEFMHDWLHRPGYPVVTVSWRPGQKTLSVKQERFLSDPKAKSDANQPWQVPLASTIPLGNDLFIKESAEITVEQTVANSKDPLILNNEGKSYFLPNYLNKEHLSSITQAISDGKVRNINRLLLLDNYLLLQRSGKSSTNALLDLLSGFKGELSESVWGSMASALGEARRLTEKNDDTNVKLDNFILGLLGNLVKDLGWNDKKTDDAQTLHLRGLVYSLAAGAKSQKIIDEGLALFKKTKEPNDLPASTRSAVFFIASRYGSDADFKKLLKMYRDTDSADEKDEIASGLTSAKETKRYEQLIDLLKTNTIRRQDLMHWFVWLLRNRYSRKAAWKWLTDNWDWLEETFSSDKSFSYFARYCGSIFSTKAEEKQFVDFFTPKESIVALSRDISLAKTEISARVAWRSANEKPVREWLNKHSQ